MPTVTALRHAQPGRVLVELDGARWRTIPTDAAARAGLTLGLELDRERLRALRRELRRSAALEAGVRAVARRDRSERAVRDLLDRRGNHPAARDEALASLRKLGAIDDDRYGSRRAEALAGRGYGDAAIAARLLADGVTEEVARVAVAGLEHEVERAERLAAARGRTVATARWLERRGFELGSIERAVPGIAESDASELG